MQRLTIEIAEGLEIRVENDADCCCGTLVLTQEGLGFRVPRQKVPCKAIIPWRQVGPIIEAFAVSAQISPELEQLTQESNEKLSS